MTAAIPKRCLLVEDEQALAEIEARVLSRMGFRVTAVTTLSAARAALADQPWDLVVLDLMLPDGHGRELANEVVRTEPRPGLLVVSGFLDAQGSIEMQALGAIVLRKAELAEHLLEMAGLALLGALRNSNKAGALLAFSRKFALSSRQRQVFELLVSGLRSKEIAMRLGVADSTIRRHVKDVCARCGVSTQTDLMTLFSRSLLGSPGVK